MRAKIITIGDEILIGQIVDKVWFEEMTEEDIFSEDMRYYNAMAEERGVSLEEYLATVLSKGSHSNLRMAGLDPEWEYVVYVYGMNTVGEKTTSIYYEAFTTTAPYQGNDVTFDFNITVNRAIAHIEITPSHEGVAYYNNLITYEDFETLYGKDINVAADAVIADVVEDYAYWDYTLAETFEYNTDYLSTAYEFEGMANTKYIAFAFKWNEQCERMSDVSFEEFEIGSIPKSENKLSMEISDVTQSTFYVKVETTNDDPYAIFAIPTKEIGKMRDDAEIFNYILSNYGTSFLYNYIFNGNIEGTFSGMEADTEYAVLLFGYEAGTLTTKITRENITTLKAGSVDACIYDIEITDIDDREAHVSIKPSDFSIFYYWNVFEASMTEEEIKEYITDKFGYDLNRDCNDIRPDYYFDVSCQGTVPEAIIAFLDSWDFESAIRLAVSLGGDSDTLTCITGGIAEAFYKEVPKPIIAEMRNRLDADWWDIINGIKALAAKHEENK